MEEPIRTLPAWTYRTPEFFEAEQREVFRKQWVMVGHVSAAAGSRRLRVADPWPASRSWSCAARTESCGRSRTSAATAARGSPTGRATAARRCAAPTTAGPTASTASCWAYPRSQGSPGSTRTPTACGRSAAACWRGSCSPTWIPIPSRCSDVMGPFAEWLAPYRPDRLVRYDTGTAVLPINWKNSIDNYLEGYHIPVGHPGLLRLVDYKQYLVETTDAHVSIARSPMRDKASKNRQERLYQRLVRPMPGLREPEANQWNFIFAFPGMTFNLYPDQIDTWTNYPLDALHTATVWQPVPATRNQRPARRAGTQAERAHQHAWSSTRTTISPTACRRDSARVSTAPEYSEPVRTGSSTSTI